MTDIDLIALAESIADDEGVDPDFYESDDPARMSTDLTMRKDVEFLDGTTETYRANVSVTPEMLADADFDPEEYLTQRLEAQIRDLKHKASEEMEINGHDLLFYMEDGFHAQCLDTGRTWSVSPEDHEHTPPLTTAPKDADAPVPRHAARVFDGSNDLPFHLKEKLMMYVIGWALEYSPDEWYSELADPTSPHHRKI